MIVPLKSLLMKKKGFLISLLFMIILIFVMFNGVAVAQTPNDPLYYKQYSPQYKTINVEPAWDIITDSHDVIVGIVDSGVNYNHPDLIDNLWKKDGAYGWNVVKDNYEVLDLIDGHGTIIAGLIGAVGDNEIGVSGTSWKANMLTIKCDDDWGNGLYNLLEGVREAVIRNASIVSMSFSNDMREYPTQEDIEYYVSGDIDQGIDAWGPIFTDYPDVLFVVAAGNQGEDMVTGPAFLAGSFNGVDYNYPNVIAVGATDLYDKRGNWWIGSSNYGEAITIVAPGVSIYSTSHINFLGNYYTFEFGHSGTSFATPLVASTAALMKSINQSLSPKEIKEILVLTGDDIDWRDNGKTVPRLNVYNAVRYVYERAVKSISVTGDNTLFPGEVAQLTTHVSPVNEKNSKNMNSLLKWTSSNPSVVSVDENGKITAKSAGTSLITVASKVDDRIYDTIEITVNSIVTPTPTPTPTVAPTPTPTVTPSPTPTPTPTKYPTGITLSVSSGSVSWDGNIMVMSVGSDIELHAEITPSDATNKLVTWFLPDESYGRITSRSTRGGESYCTIHADSPCGTMFLYVTSEAKSSVTKTQGIQIV